MSRYLGFFTAKWRPPRNVETSFAGKTVIITGSNCGVGFAAALKFVSLGASKVILGVRSIEKGENAQKQIETQTGKEGVVEVWKLDMNDYDSIKAFVKRAGELAQLDIAILNAGVYSVNYELSKYGWQSTIQVNTLSTALLAILLLSKLRASKASSTDKPVLEIVGSGSHLSATVTPQQDGSENLLEAFNHKEDFTPSRQYRISKLFVQYAMKEIAKIAGDDVVVLSVCPGPCRSDIGRGYMTNTILVIAARIIQFLLLRTSEQGSRTLVSGPLQGQHVHGRFWKDDIVQP